MKQNEKRQDEKRQDEKEKWDKARQEIMQNLDELRQER